MERRQFYRAGPHMSVQLEPAGMPPIAGEIKDVSVRGLQVICSGSLALGTSCGVTISLAAEPDEESIRGRATVVRVTPEGLALQITEIDGPDSYRHLCNLVMYNAEDPDRVKQEIERWLARGRPDSAP